MKKLPKKMYPAVIKMCASLCLFGFVVRLTADYFKHYPYGSAPFRLYAAERFCEFCLPAAALFIAARYIEKRLARKAEEMEVRE